MAKIKIITDSTSDLSIEEIERYDVEVVPMTVTIDGEEFIDMDNKEYIYKMRTAKQFFTSQPSVGKFLEIYKKWTELGYKVISIHVSSVLSGTYSTAHSASKEFDGVYVIDTKTASRGIKYVIENCYNYILEGVEILEIIKRLNKKTKDILTYVTIDKLDNLVRGGRIKKTSGLIGGILNLKILTKLCEEELMVVDKVRGKKKLVQALIKTILIDIKDRTVKQISLVDTISDEYIKEIREAIYDNVGYLIPDNNIRTTTPAVSTHAGEGSVGVIIELHEQ
ncbi:DegV family protein [Gemella sp. GH3]|uniref:DegV family protein n=1 Tax=unclassified Gemella TaxID=2624949 RepID=UPI0015CF9B66|nr:MULTISPECIES: DegV family protein [unclassified Gemella]MBF0713577.1 DegV family protein [Gemella sp. GH3.1]NYS50529.1 DegV family protein [Gemella sp. GH3]